MARSWSICLRDEPPRRWTPKCSRRSPRGCEGKTAQGSCAQSPVPRRHAGVGTAAESWSWEAPCFPAANSRALAQPCLRAVLAGPFGRTEVQFPPSGTRQCRELFWSVITERAVPCTLAGLSQRARRGEALKTALGALSLSFVLCFFWPCSVCRLCLRVAKCHQHRRHRGNTRNKERHRSVLRRGPTTTRRGHAGFPGWQEQVAGTHTHTHAHPCPRPVLPRCGAGGEASSRWGSGRSARGGSRQRVGSSACGSGAGAAGGVIQPSAGELPVPTLCLFLRRSKLACAEQEDNCYLLCGLRGGSSLRLSTAGGSCGPGFAPSPGFARGGCWGPVPHGGHTREPDPARAGEAKEGWRLPGVLSAWESPPLGLLDGSWRKAKPSSSSKAPTG